MSGGGIRARECRFAKSAGEFCFLRKNLSGGQMRKYELHSLGADQQSVGGSVRKGQRTAPAPFSCESFISVP